MKRACRLLGVLGLLTMVGCSSPTTTAPPTASGVIVLVDGKEMPRTYDSIRKSEVFVAGRTEFSYDLAIPEFRILHYGADGKVSSATRLNRDEKNHFTVRRALPSGKVILEELSFSGWNWVHHSVGEDSDYTLRGSHPAVAEFLRSDRAITPSTEKQ